MIELYNTITSGVPVSEKLGGTQLKINGEHQNPFIKMLYLSRKYK
jgi:hypothetical protein